MGYERSLTYAAQMQVDRYVEEQTAKAIALLDSQQTAKDLLRLLSSGSRRSTPGFVLRRHLQAQGELVSREECADLSQTGNVPWPPEITYRLAAALSSISYRRHGLVISTENWEKYLEDGWDDRIHRDTIFKLAIVTGMGRESTIDLLMACNEAPYDLREPLELICWFCQYLPGLYTWQGVQRLLRGSRKLCQEAEDSEKSPPAPAPGGTQLLRQGVDRLLGLGDPEGEAAEQRLMALIAENRGELAGVSLTAQSRYLRLLDYLSALYLSGKKGSLHKLIGAMLEAQQWEFDDLIQNPTGARYVLLTYPGDSAAQGKTRRLDPYQGEIAMFCKRYYARAYAIKRGTTGGRESKTANGSARKGKKTHVDRRDILLLGYFLITGYHGADAPSRSRFWDLTAQGGDLDRRMELVREDLDSLDRAGDVKEKQVLCCRVLNELLAEFAFRPLYFPAVFDRFILLSLLTDNPAQTAQQLLG